MSQDRHSAEWEKNKFCACVPCEKRPCVAGTKKNYKEVCKPSWANWQFGQKDGMKPYEAHHILCWSCVISEVFANNTKCRAILRGTKWCVNNRKNMIALPLWGHTVKWYMKNDDAAPFKNLPNHNRDHPRYLKEVKGELKQIVKDVQVEKDKHGKAEDIDVAGDLNDLSDDFETTLKRRGKTRGGIDKRGRPHVGTHSCIELGTEEPNSLWYMPFSMAEVPKPRHFGSFKNKWSLIRLAESLLGAR